MASHGVARNNSFARLASSAYLPSSFSETGCATGIPCASANCLTGEACRCMPRPAGRSGWVRTRGISKPAAWSFSSATRANSGVPAKTTRITVIVKTPASGSPAVAAAEAGAAGEGPDARQGSTHSVALVFLLLLDHLGLDAVALERREVRDKHLSHQVVHLVLD